MTAEVLVMNRLAVAVAADSAVTVGEGEGQKVYQSANKLFALSKHVPVGVMVYGSADFMEVPWETVVKMYRKHLGRSSFPHLGDYAAHFYEFIESNRTLFPIEAQDRYVSSEAGAYLHSLGAELKSEIETKFKGKQEIKLGEVRRTLTGFLHKRLRELRAVDGSAGMENGYVETLVSRYGERLKHAVATVFGDLPLTRVGRSLVEKILAETFYRQIAREETMSGVVVMGFGDDDVFPHAEECSCRGIACDKLWRNPGRTADVQRDNIAVIMPFAQFEMVETFMEGIDPRLGRFFVSMLRRLLERYVDEVADALPGVEDEARKSFKKHLGTISRQQVSELEKSVGQYRRTKHVLPIMTMIGALPKDELARVAEALVNLTSFKRRVSVEAETVAGPIDVAVISRGDGFVWVKRKHYFPTEANPGWVERSLLT